MSKVVTLTAATWALAVMGLMGQTTPQQVTATEVTEAQATEDDGSDFSFTESQLDEDVDAAQTISNVASSNNDPYLSQVGFKWSAMRFRVRALDNMYSTTFLNGLEFNDLELGRYNYSLLGGLNDLTRSKEGSTGYENNSFGVTGIGGGDNINLRASHVAKGQKFTLTACNRNYKARAIYTFGTGVMARGWAFAGSIGYRWADEGVIEGTFYDSFSYYLGAEKRWDRHSLAISTFGAPTKRAQQGASTEEVYWLANSHYYNSNWGYQDGKKRNARVVKDFEPTLVVTWDWRPDARNLLVTTGAFKYSNYSSSALGWAGDAYDPRPDYYKNLPSSIFNVYDPEYLGTEWQSSNPQAKEQWTALYDFWTSSKANRQINWDRMYLVNQQNALLGGDALYYLERRHNDQLVWALSSTWTHTMGRSQKLLAGVYLNHTVGLHYKTMDDLLGGNWFTDVDKYAINDYGRDAMQAQSDMRNPNRKVREGDRFGYDYNTYVDVAKLWSQYGVQRGPWDLDLSAHLVATQMQRDGKMQNGQGQVLQQDGSYHDNSYGKSGWARFLGGGGKIQLAWTPIAGQRLSIGGSAEKKAPLVRNAFVAPRVQNNYVDNLKLESILSGEVTWMVQVGASFVGKANAYYTRFINGVEQTAFYNDANFSFTYLTMSKVRRQHYGVELAMSYKILSNLSVHAMGTLSGAEYTNNPYAQLNTEGMNQEDNAKVNLWMNPITGEKQDLRVLAKGMKVGSTPLTAVNLGLKYNKNYWFLEFNANYYNNVYVGFSPYRRLSNIVENYVFDNQSAYLTTKAYATETYPISTDEERDAFRQHLKENGGVVFDQYGNIVGSFGAEQEKHDGGWMFDASIGKSLRFKNRSTMSINLQLQNISNNTDLRTGGYEQNRDDNYYTLSSDPKIGKQKTYLFSKNPKYYYANAFNFYLNVSYRF